MLSRDRTRRPSRGLSSRSERRLPHNPVVDRLESRVLLAGDVDPTFGVQVTTDFNLRGDVALDVARQPEDGKLVVVGYSRGDDRTDSDLALARYDSNGALDSAFGTNASTTIGLVKVVGGGGRVVLSHADPVERDRGEAGHHVAVQSDGKIVVSAGIDGMMTLVRFNADGSLDTTFDGDGLAQMSDQSIVTEAGTTVVDEGRTDLAVLPDGSYLLSGTQSFPTPTPTRPNATSDMNWVLAKYDAVGRLVPTFGNGGRVVTDFAGAGFTTDDGDPITHSWDETYRILVLPNGQIIQAGGNEVLRSTPFFRNSISFVRFNADGSVDESFGGARYFRSHPQESLVTSGDGQLGRTVIEFLQKPESAEEPDTFGTKPFVNVTGLTNVAGGGIVAAGVEMYRTFVQAPDKNASRINVYKLDDDGFLDTAFAGDGIYQGLPVDGRENQIDAPTAVLQRPDGKINVLGKSGEGEVVSAPGSFLLLQLNPDGSPDTSLGPNGEKLFGGGATIGRFNSALLQPDGKLVAVGQSGQGINRGKGVGFEPIDSDFVVGRYNPDGSPDVTFGRDNAVIPEMSVLAQVVQSDGKIVAAGYRGGLADGTARGVVARYTADGAPDPGFAVRPTDGNGTIGMETDAFQTGDAATIAAAVHAVAIGPGGAIYVAGVSGSQLAVARFTASGDPDTTFDDDGLRVIDFGAAGGLDAGYGIAVLADGSSIVAGESAGDWLLVKFQPDGDLDASFGGDGLVTHDRGSDQDVAVTPLLVAGNKLLVSGTAFSAGSRTIQLVRFNADGSVDNTFAAGGLSTGFTTAVLGVDDAFNRLDARSIAIDPAGNIVVAGAAGNDAGVARYSADGNPDATFGDAGRVTFDWGGTDDPDSIVLGAGGQLFLSGTVESASAPGVVVAALTPDGQRRTDFGTDGVLNLDAAATGGLPRLFRNDVLSRHGLASRQGDRLIVASREQRGTSDQSRRSSLQRLEAPDTTAPTAAAAPTAPIFVGGPGATTQSFVVTYTDNVAVDLATLGIDDVTVVGPGGAIPVVLAVTIQPGSGSVRTVRYTVNAPGGSFDAADNGTYTITATPGAVADTSGNALAAGQLGAFTVNILPVDPAGPDFTVTFTQPVGGSFVGGARGRATMTVTNAAGAGRSAAPGNVAVYLSTDEFVDGTDRHLGTAVVRRPTPAGRAVPARLNRFVYPTDLPAGTYHVLARVDDANAEQEQDEINNVTDGGTITLTPPFVDIVPVSLTGVKVVRGRGTATVLVRNDGNVPLKGVITSSLVASSDATLDAGDTVVGAISVRGNIKNGLTKRVRVRFTVPSTVTGPFTLIATAAGPDDPTPAQTVSAPATVS